MWWNKPATDALNEVRKLDFQKLGKDGITSTVAKYMPPETEVPAADREAYKKAVGLLSEQLATAVMSFPLMVRAIRLSLEGVNPGLEEAARTCPVARSLHPDVQVPIEFSYALG